MFSKGFFLYIKINNYLFLFQVQKNLKAGGNEWDKDSPVWNNTQYLNNIYNEYKKNFLRDMQ